MIVTAENLTIIYKKMQEFVNPENKNGFYRYFVAWVYKNWSQSEYYDTKTVDVGYDCSYYPVKTNKSNKEKCHTYAEFINSNNGNSVATFNSGSGIACATWDKQLQELFGDRCSVELERLITEFNLELPPTHISDSVWDAIWGEEFDYEKESDLYNVSDEIASEFNSFGCGLEPYTVNPQFDLNGDSSFEETDFSDWTLDDFRKACIAN